MLSRRIDLPLGENALASLDVLTGIHTVTHDRQTKRWTSVQQWFYLCVGSISKNY